MNNPYETLGIQRTASAADIKKAYRVLANKWHPDKNQGDPTAEQKFKEIKAAYEILSDDHKRAQFDRMGNANFNAGHSGPFNFNDIFSTVFKQPKAPTQQGIVGITLEESVAGTTRNIQYDTQTTCTTCNGQGTTQPNNVEHCQQCNGQGHIQHPHMPGMRFQCPACNGRGKVIKNPCGVCQGTGIQNQRVQKNVVFPKGINDKETINLGDLVLVVQIQPHPMYTRQGYDLHTKITVDAIDAILGTVCEFETIQKDKINITIPAGTQPGTRLKLSNKGVSRDAVQGHLYCDIVINIPTNITDRQRELLHEYKTIQS